MAISVETIEHLENPRAFVRELVRITQPGGWIVVTTPNQRSLVSLGALLLKGHFSAFGATQLPGASNGTARYRPVPDCGREPSAAKWRSSSRASGECRCRAFDIRGRCRGCFDARLSDNVLLVARKRA